MKLHFVRQRAMEPKALAAMRTVSVVPDSYAPEVYYGMDSRGREHMHVVLSRDEYSPTDHRWHISISCEERVPTWDEVALACHTLRPGVPFVLGVPPKSWWLNLHSNVLHAWECKDAGLLAEWRLNARGDTPT